MITEKAVYEFESRRHEGAMEEIEPPMPPGRGQSVRDERAEEYFTWKGARTAEDFHRYIKNVRGELKLSHSGILKDASIAQALARSNPHIKQDLVDMEEKLRELGHLPQAVKLASAELPPCNRPDKPAKASRDKKHIEQLEQKLAAVQLERDDLKEALRRCNLLEQYLSDTMRLPR